MHERGMMRDAMRAAGEAAARDGGMLCGVSLRIGLASGVTAASARMHAEAIAEEWWGFAPDIEVTESDDPGDPGADGVTVMSIRVES